jgi:hypothetical protein
MAEPKTMNGGKPNPDPSVLTTENLRREIANLKDILEGRLAANDKAIELVQHATNEFRNDNRDLIAGAVGQLHTLIAAEIKILSNVTEVRFGSIETQFSERDKRTEQLSLADKTAIAAALQAQKEAAGAQNESNAASVTKQEAAFTKLLDQNQTLFQTAMSALTTQLNDVKSRLDKGEGHSKGAGDLWGYVAGAVGLLIAFGTLLAMSFHGH